MESPFDFLKQAKPASIHRLLETLPLSDVAIVLAGLPGSLCAQIMIQYPDPARRSEIAAALREARKAEPGEALAVAERIRVKLVAGRDKLAASRENSRAQTKSEGEPSRARSQPTGSQLHPAPRPQTPPPPTPPPPAAPAKPEDPPPSAPVNPGAFIPSARNPYGAGRSGGTSTSSRSAYPQGASHASHASAKSKSHPPHSHSSHAKEAKPSPWMPRQADASPINGPPLPNRPPPVAGDPLKSPLVKNGLADFLGRAKEMAKDFAKEMLAPRPVGQADKGQPVRSQVKPPHRHGGNQPGKDGTPEPREGVVSAGSVEVLKTPRVIGPAAKGTVRSPAKPGKPADDLLRLLLEKKSARPEAREGVISSRTLEVSKTPRVIGPTKKGAVLPPPGKARRMDGKAIMAAILREVDPDFRRQVEKDDPSLFRELRGRMFYFDDLNFTDDAALARVFTVASAEDASLALRFASPALRERVLKVVSPGRAEALKAPVKAGRTGMDAIEAAQKRVLEVALQLQAAGRILIDPRDPDLAGK